MNEPRPLKNEFPCFDMILQRRRNGISPYLAPFVILSLLSVELGLVLLSCYFSEACLAPKQGASNATQQTPSLYYSICSSVSPLETQDPHIQETTM
jgi:hypothetical protein